MELLSVNGDNGGYKMTNELPPKRRFRQYEIEEEKRLVEEAKKRGIDYTPKTFPDEEDEDDKWYADYEEKQAEIRRRSTKHNDL